MGDAVAREPVLDVDVIASFCQMRASFLSAAGEVSLHRVEDTLARAVGFGRDPAGRKA